MCWRNVHYWIHKSVNRRTAWSLFETEAKDFLKEKIGYSSNQILFAIFNSRNSSNRKRMEIGIKYMTDDAFAIIEILIRKNNRASLCHSRSR